MYSRDFEKEFVPMKGLIKRRALRGLRTMGKHSLVRVYQLQPDGTKVFKRYETLEGVPCDENGVLLGEVDFSKTRR